MQRVRIGSRDTFLKKAEGVLFTGRKSFGTRATFIGTLLLGTTCAVGAVASFFTGIEPNRYLTGGFATVAAYSMFKSADEMADHWWVEER